MPKLNSKKITMSPMHHPTHTHRGGEGQHHHGQGGRRGASQSSDIYIYIYILYAHIETYDVYIYTCANTNIVSGETDYGCVLCDQIVIIWSVHSLSLLCMFTDANLVCVCHALACPCECFGYCLSAHAFVMFPIRVFSVGRSYVLF